MVQSSVRVPWARSVLYGVALTVVIGSHGASGATADNSKNSPAVDDEFNPDLILMSEVDKGIARLKKELAGFQALSAMDKVAMGSGLVAKRIDGLETAMTRLERLVDLFKNRRPRRTVMTLDRATQGYKPSMGYCKLNSLMSQFVRDWGSGNDHVRRTQQDIILKVVKEQAEASNGAGLGSVLVPGDALGRLSWDLSNLGVFSEVVAVEASPLFAEVANFMLNCVEEPFEITPFATVMDNQETVDGHLRTVSVPSPMPTPPKGGPFTMTVGSFDELFKKGGARHRQFNYVITCFFIDTYPGSVTDALTTIADLLAPGGVWINYGPLHYHGNYYPKLSWEEITALLPSRGFSIIKNEHVMRAQYDQPTEDTYHPTIYNPQFLVAKKDAAEK